MSLKHAILGFLSYRSMTGYDLKKAFDRSIQHFWPANQSQIYRTLADLTAANLVEKEVIEREERLDMNIYHITEEGREEMRQWLAAPLPTQKYREPFMIQIYFGGQIADEKLIALMEHELRELEERVTLYKAIFALENQRFETAADKRAFFLSLTTLEMGLLSNLTAIDWMKSLIERVKSRSYTFNGFN